MPAMYAHYSFAVLVHFVSVYDMILDYSSNKFNTGDCL